MENKDEILNLDYNIRRLCLIALNRYDMIADAAQALGICTRSLYRYRRQYNIYLHPKTKQYFIPEQHQLKRA